jgi:hypothetical protein
MIEMPAAELEKLALDTARELAGPDVIEQVEIQSVIDLYDRPAYHFTFLMNKERVTDGIGLFRTRFRQNLREKLEARGDGHLPLIRTLERADWERRGVAPIY